MKFKYFDNNKRYYTLNYFYRKKFDSKIAKISLDGNFTCPNIDGTKSFGGCIFCRSGSTSTNKNIKFDLDEQFETKVFSLNKKWKDSKYIIYFQANTNTYDTVENLKKRFEPLLEKKDVVGISIATRDDSITDEVYEYLSDINQRTFLTVELGLQTINQKSTKFINRASTLESFVKCVKKLRYLKIDVVVHIINGLPNETKQDMLNNIIFLNEMDIQGIKIHNLFIEKGTKLAQIYEKDKFKTITRDEFVDVVCDQIELLKDNIVIHRLTGDPDEKYLIEPNWVVKKFTVINEIDKELNRRNTIQGYHQSVLNYTKNIWEKNLSHNDNVIDATCGNGHDTLYLSGIVRNGKVYALDIQEDAISSTFKKLNENSIQNVEIFQLNHAEIDTLKLNKKIKLIHFNLGYLPNSDKTICTTWETTKIAIDKSYQMLEKNGLITVVVYPGHKEGKTESLNLLKHIEKYSHKIMRNTEKHSAPYLIIIKKNT